MKPVTQDRLYSDEGVGSGNCLNACLASLLEVPLWMVPTFDEMHGRGSVLVYDRIDQWLTRMFGLELGLKGRHDPEQLPEFYIASGMSSRGVMHAVIYSRGVLAHDPHPSRAGIAEVQHCYFLTPNTSFSRNEPKASGSAGSES